MLCYCRIRSPYALCKKQSDGVQEAVHTVATMHGGNNRTGWRDEAYHQHSAEEGASAIYSHWMKPLSAVAWGARRISRTLLTSHTVREKRASRMRLA